MTSGNPYDEDYDEDVITKREARTLNAETDKKQKKLNLITEAKL